MSSLATRKLRQSLPTLAVTALMLAGKILLKG